ncbi:MAG TPA: DUF1641 domain-containing protein [Natrialbaceae archaeon]|nr:DUF1641 domain-containing protein [Natrialbaceae archaeon]
MSEPELSQDDALVDAIEENPEAVADFVRRLDAVNELLTIVELGSGAMDDEMVMELAGTADLLVESADGLATRDTVELANAVGENGEELSEAVDTMVELQESGTLDDLADAAEVVSLAGGAMDDEMVMTLAQAGNNLGEVADAAADPAASRGMQMLLDSISESCVHKQAPEKMGMIGLMKAIRDPDVQRGLGFWMSVAKNAGAMINERTCPPDEE